MCRLGKGCQALKNSPILALIRRLGEGCERFDKLAELYKYQPMDDLRRLWENGFLTAEMGITIVVAVVATATVAWPSNPQFSIRSFVKKFFVLVGEHLQRFIEPRCTCALWKTERLQPSILCPVHGCSCCAEAKTLRAAFQKVVENREVMVEEWPLLDALQRLSGACRGCLRCPLHGTDSTKNRDALSPDQGNAYRTAGKTSSFTLSRLEDAQARADLKKRIKNSDENKVLTTLMGGQMFGLELMAATGIGQGAIYPLLQRLEFVGFVRSHEEQVHLPLGERGGRPRRYYELTAKGRHEVKILGPAELGPENTGFRPVSVEELLERFKPLPGTCENCGAGAEQHYYFNSEFVYCRCKGFFNPQENNHPVCTCGGFKPAPPPPTSIPGGGRNQSE